MSFGLNIFSSNALLFSIDFQWNSNLKSRVEETEVVYLEFYRKTLKQDVSGAPLSYPVQPLHSHHLIVLPAHSKMNKSL